MDDDAVMIGLDWGTTSLRAYRIGTGGAVLEQRSAAAGILQVPDGDFAGTLKASVGDWLEREPDLPVLAAGMIGSRQGWREVDYAPCPAGLDELAHGLAPVTGIGGRVVHLVPGVARAADPNGFPDVMRGEETQILGASSAAAGGQHCFVLPGTHSKWAWAEHGRIARFATYMTGEVYACLVQHSILGRLMSGHDADAEAFEQGLARARASAGDPPGRLLHDLFSARTLGLFAAVPPTGLASYLSGLLIGCRGRGGPGGHSTGRGDHPRQQRAGAALCPGDRCERWQGGRGRHGCRGARAVRDRAGGGNAGGEQPWMSSLRPPWQHCRW